MFYFGEHPGESDIFDSLIRERLKEIQTALLVSDLSEEERDIRKFWILIGLMETGAVDLIKEEVRKFHPHDVRLLLAFHLGCFMLEHHRVAAKDEKKVASDICKHLGERIAPLRQQLLKEWRSELLEIRKGEIRAIEFPKSAEQEQTLLQPPPPESPNTTRPGAA